VVPRSSCALLTVRYQTRPGPAPRVEDPGTRSHTRRRSRGRGRGLRAFRAT